MIFRSPDEAAAGGIEATAAEPVAPPLDRPAPAAAPAGLCFVNKLSCV